MDGNAFNKILRTGADLDVAARSMATQARYAAPSAAPAGPPAGQPGMRGIAKRLLRPLKPLLRLILFRFRDYMNRPVLDRVAVLEAGITELQHTIAGLASAIAAQQSRTDADHASAVAPLASQLNRIELYAATSARRMAVSCGPDEVLVRTEVGYVLCSATDHALIANLVESGDLEPGTRALIQRLLRPGDVFIDIGANIGMHTLAAARALHGRGRVVAFEPFAPTERLLSKSVWLNGFADIVEVHQAAVSSRDGDQTLYLGATSGHNSLYRLADEGQPQGATSVVPVVRLDHVLPSGTAVNLIKIDVEGAELEVLDGCRALLATSPDAALIVEFGHSHLVRTGLTTQDWMEAFHALGLQHRVIHAGTGALEDWSAADLERAGSANLLFARPQSPAWRLAGGRT